VPLGIYIVRRLDRKTQLPLVVTFPAVWTALEYFRAHFLTGFPWYFLGHTQHDFLVLAQIADIGGGYMVTFLVAGVNALVFEAVWQTFSESRQPISIRHLLWQTLAMVVALAGTLAYGLWRLHQENFTPGPRVALIQGSLDQRIRNAASEDAENAAVKTMQHHFGDLSNLAAAAHPKADLIVWSETSYPDARNIERDALRWGTRALLGLNSIIQDEGGKERQYNSALMVYADGSIGPRYDKIHRVPFGEYVPMKDWLPFMNVFAPYDYEYGVQAGTQMTQFSLGNFHFGALICYEDTDPALARQYVSAGDFKADFLVNISNDGWFDGTSEHEEHLAICRFRAIECRRAVARAVNMGVSAIIDGGGRVLQPKAVQPTSGSEGAPVWEVNWSEEKMPELEIGEWRRFKKVAGVLIGSIPIDQRFSLYAQWGDWFPQGCWLVVILGLIWSFIVRPAK